MLNKYTLGDGDIEYEIIDYTANYMDSNLNICLPIFMIHGNHDYPNSDYENLSVLDLLHAAKYVNLFGKHHISKKIQVKPIVFTKGETAIALYGIGYIKDRHFHVMLEEGSVEFIKP